MIESTALLFLTGSLQRKFNTERGPNTPYNINMQSPAQVSRYVHDGMPIAYVDLETIDHRPQYQWGERMTVWFKLHPNDNEGIPISYALGNGCDDLIGARIPAPWDAHVHAKLALRIHVSIPLNVILSDTHQ